MGPARAVPQLVPLRLALDNLAFAVDHVDIVLTPGLAHRSRGGPGWCREGQVGAGPPVFGQRQFPSLDEEHAIRRFSENRRDRTRRPPLVERLRPPQDDFVLAGHVSAALLLLLPFLLANQPGYARERYGDQNPQA